MNRATMRLLLSLWVLSVGGVVFGQTPTPSPTASPTVSPTASPTASPTPSPTPVDLYVTARNPLSPNTVRMLSGLRLDDQYTTFVLDMGADVRTTIHVDRGIMSGSAHVIEDNVVAGALIGGAENTLTDDETFVTDGGSVVGARSAAALGGELNILSGHSSVSLGGSYNTTYGAYTIVGGQGNQGGSAGSAIWGWWADTPLEENLFGITDFTDTAWAVGNGAEGARSNAAWMDWYGNLTLSGAITATGVVLTTGSLELGALDPNAVVYVNAAGELEAVAANVGFDELTGLFTIGNAAAALDEFNFTTYGDIIAYSGAAGASADMILFGADSELFDSDANENTLAFWGPAIPVFGSPLSSDPLLAYDGSTLTAPNVQTTGAIAAGTTIYQVGQAANGGRLFFVGASGEHVTDADLTFATDDLTVGDDVLAAGLVSSDLTSGRVPFATTGGRLTDAATLAFNSGTGALSATTFSGAHTGTFSGSTVTASSLTAGHVVYASTAGLLATDGAVDSGLEYYPVDDQFRVSGATAHVGVRDGTYMRGELGLGDLILSNAAGTDVVSLGITSPNYINGTQSARDFIVSSDNVVSMLMVDGTNDFVGINDATPDATLDVVSGTESLRFTQDETNAFVVSAPDGGLILESTNQVQLDGTYIPFEISNAEAARFDSSSRFKMGTTAAVTDADVGIMGDVGAAGAATYLYLWNDTTTAATLSGLRVGIDASEAATINHYEDTKITASVGSTLVDFITLDVSTTPDEMRVNEDGADLDTVIEGDTAEVLMVDASLDVTRHLKGYVDDIEDVTVSGDTITVTKSFVRVTSETGTTDTVSTINGPNIVGFRVTIIALATHTITFTETGGGNIYMGADAGVIGSNFDTMAFIAVDASDGYARVSGRAAN